MCTDRTLKSHVERWHELNAEKKRIEAELKIESSMWRHIYSSD